MRVKCISTFPSEEQIAELGKEFYRERDFHLTLGKEYVVFALEFHRESKTLGTGAWVAILTDFDVLTTVPLCLFNLTDGQLSRHWRAEVLKDQTVLISPPLLLRDFFYEELAELEGQAVADFNRLRSQMEREAWESQEGAESTPARGPR